MQMTFSDYDKLIEKYDSMESSARPYGLTKKDKELIEKDPDRYIHFLLYLSEHLSKDDLFYNFDADKPADTIRWINAFLRKHLILVD